MIGRRAVLLGGQILVVGVLLAVIYFTLLRPGDDDSLFGVDAPKDGPQIAQGPKDRDDRDRDGDRDRGRRGTGGDRGRLGGLAGPGTARPSGFALTPPPAGGGPGGEPGPDEEADDSPGSDQYGSTLARLETMLDPGQ